MKRVALLGSTGSIGRQTLEVIRANPERFTLVSMAAGKNIPLIIEQAHQFKPSLFPLQHRKLLSKLNISYHPESR